MHLISQPPVKPSSCAFQRSKARSLAFALVTSSQLLVNNAGAVEQPDLLRTATLSSITGAAHYSSLEGANLSPQQLNSHTESITSQDADPKPKPEPEPEPEPEPAIASAGSNSYHHSWLDQETWITDIGTLLYRDDDKDGYFSGFSLTVDADTYFQQAQIYASIGLQRAYGQRERLHTTANFTIYSNELSDEYRIDIDLLSNYQAGEYDLFIDLHDAYDHRLLDSVSAMDFSNLFRLPLESEDLDRYYESEQGADPVHHHNPSTTPVNSDIRVVEYAGSSGFFLLMAMLAMVSLRISETVRYKSRWLGFSFRW